MKRPVIQAFCDIAWAEHNELVPAEYVDVPLKFGDEEVMLDLSQGGYELITKAIDSFKRAGRPAPAKSERRNWTAGSRTEAVEYFRRMREFAKARGIKYQSPNGNVWYSATLRRAFEEHIKAEAGNPGDPGDLDGKVAR